MRAIEHINDPAQLKQVAVLLEKENTRLHTRLEKALTEVAQLRGEDSREKIQLELEKLQAEMARIQRRLLGNPSERRPHLHSGEPAKTLPRRGHGPTQQPKLPMETAVHELGVDDLTCPACSGELKEWPQQFEESEEVSVIERRYVLVTHRRKKYRCACNGVVVTAPPPLKVIPGGRYALGFAVSVAINKHLDHMPLERQCRMMRRHGLNVSSQTLWDQVQALGNLLEPNYNKLKQRILSSPRIHADETWWRVQQKKAKNWWSWCLTNDDTVLYQILPNRSKECAATALNGYSNIVVADGYVVYKILARGSPGKKFKLAHCWAHVRRHFVDIETFYPEPCAEVLRLIGELYNVERAVPKTAYTQVNEEARQQLRDEKSRDLIRQIHEWAYAQHASPGSELAKAIHYMLRIWKGLTLFLEDPRIPLDNNAAERALRGPIIGRKNYYGARSVEGARITAILHSLLETAKLCNVDPAVYLKTAVTRIIKDPSDVMLPSELIGT